MASKDLQVDAQPDGSGSVWRVTVRGDLDLATSQQLQDVFETAMQQGARIVQADLSDVTFLDSTGLRALLAASATLQELDGSLTCVGLSPAAERVLELTGTIEQLRNTAVTAATDDTSD